MTKEYLFKPGQSGNKAGRPKGSTGKDLIEKAVNVDDIESKKDCLRAIMFLDKPGLKRFDLRLSQVSHKQQVKAFQMLRELNVN